MIDHAFLNITLAFQQTLDKSYQYLVFLTLQSRLGKVPKNNLLAHDVWHILLL